MEATVQVSQITYTRAGPAEQMAEVLEIDERAKVYRSVLCRRGGSSRLPRAATPESARIEKAEKLSSRKDDALPFAQNFFQRVGVDLLVRIWEYVHQGKLSDILGLMLSSKAIYSRMEKEPDLLLQIAKNNFSFIYLTRAPSFHRFKDLLDYAEPSNGAELSYDHFSSQQILRNSRLLGNPCFELDLKLWPKRIYQGEDMCLFKCFCTKQTLQAIETLFREFEEAHNAIAMRIFLPCRNHLPFSYHDSSLYVYSSKEEDFFDQFRHRPTKAVCFVRFTLQNLRYRFSLVAKQFYGAS